MATLTRSLEPRGCPRIFRRAFPVSLACPRLNRFTLALAIALSLGTAAGRASAGETDDVASKVCKRFTDLNATRDCLQRLSGRFVDPQVIPICERWFHTSDQVACLEKLSDRRYSAAELGVCDRYDRGNPALAQDCLAGMRQPRRGPAPQSAEGGAYRCTDPNLVRDLMAARQKLRDGDSAGGERALSAILAQLGR